MKIADQRLFRKFDSFKEELFRKKQPKNMSPPNPLTPKLHMLLPFTLIAGGLYLAYQQAPSLVDLLLTRHLITHQQLLAYRTLSKTVICRFQEFKLNPKGSSQPSLPNQLYTTQLESDELYLKDQRPQKVVEYELERKCSWWILGIGNSQKMVLLNEKGDLVSRTINSKLMVGSFRVWKHKEDRVIKRQKIFERYVKEKDSVGKQCSTVNSLNRIFLPSEEYERVMEQCASASTKIAKRIQTLISNRLYQEAKQ